MGFFYGFSKISRIFSGGVFYGGFFLCKFRESCWFTICKLNTSHNDNPIKFCFLLLHSQSSLLVNYTINNLILCSLLGRFWKLFTDWQHFRLHLEHTNLSKSIYTVAVLRNAHAFESAHPQSYVIAHMSFRGKLSSYKPNNR